MSEKHEIEMRAGPPPLRITDYRVQPAAAPAAAHDVGSASMPALPPAGSPSPTPAAEAAASATTSASDSGLRSENGPPMSSQGADPSRGEPVAVLELRRNYQRLLRELEAARSALPGLAGAVQTALHLARERAIEAKIAPGHDAARLLDDARERLSRAAEAEAAANAETDALQVAADRVGKELAAAAAAAQRDDEGLVRGVILDREALDRMKNSLRDAIDWLHLATRLRGAPTGNIQALVADAIGQQGGLSGEAMHKRATELFRRVLSQAKAKEAKA